MLKYGVVTRLVKPGMMRCRMDCLLNHGFVQVVPIEGIASGLRANRTLST